MSKKKTNLKDYYTGALNGFLLGALLGVGSALIIPKIFLASPKLKVGECISNGLYIEKIVEIKRENGDYVTIGYLGSGKTTLPDNTPFWLIEEKSKVNCLTGELLDEKK
jgi:hypothetical protein